MTSLIDQVWPEEGLERVEACPYCGSRRRSLAYKDVQDWSFNCAPGKWDYWDCGDCKSLYLDPRPTPSTVGSAYQDYYTHASGRPASLIQSLKLRLRNECLSQRFQSSMTPRLNLPQFLSGVVELIGKRVHMPFGGMILAKLPRGRFIDVGCGAGNTVALARQLGWDAMGLEIDPSAVRTAQAGGLRIEEGTYEKLALYERQFSCIMCSHVLEHVHNPLDLLEKVKRALKPGGCLLLILPNSLSALRYHFGPDWRGLEAPRHLSIPAQPKLLQLLKGLGFVTESMADNGTETAAESYRIQRRGSIPLREDFRNARQLEIRPLASPAANDFIKLVCFLPSAVVQ
jgi:2-polyprenyl-3-methyl-5-hydroxy-6-metoxy-1,4-benzoquinol methylase